MKGRTPSPDMSEATYATVDKNESSPAKEKDGAPEIVSSSTGALELESETAPSLGLVWLWHPTDALLNETVAWIWQDFANSV